MYEYSISINESYSLKLYLTPRHLSNTYDVFHGKVTLLCGNECESLSYISDTTTMVLKKYVHKKSYLIMYKNMFSASHIRFGNQPLISSDPFY